MAAAIPVIDFRVKASRQAGPGVSSALKGKGARRSEGGDLGPSGAGGAEVLARDTDPGLGGGFASPPPNVEDKMLHTFLWKNKLADRAGKRNAGLVTAVFQIPPVKRKSRCVRIG